MINIPSLPGACFTNMFKPCAIIPVYNHPQSIHSVIAQLTKANLTCFVIDDGSSPLCREYLATICDKDPLIKLIRHADNQGKGAAVCDGLIMASESGFTHALQVDSDGQHNLADIPRFLDAAKKHPNAVISGVRNRKKMPRARRYGRWINDFWVWVHTLSLEIKDSMCGYRCYPLQETMALLQTTSIGKRMDFDTDILIGLYWNDVPLAQIETDIRYNDAIVSHFDLLWDNLRISKMHTKHFFGMLARLPRLLAKHF